MAKVKKRARRAFTLLNPPKQNTQFDFGEVYRHIRTNIEFSTVDKDIHSIAITSTQPFEAKSTTALNLAIVFATKYAKVLIVDCDLRKSQLHQYLKLSNKLGLTNALREYSKTHEVNPSYFQSVSDKSFVGSLSVLTSGVKVPNPGEILSSATFSSFIQELKKEYDFIILDCPPVASVSDAIPVSHAVDGTIFVCSCQDTNRKDAMSAISLLRQSNVNILGTVLTKADTYSHGYGYGYGYGYRY